MLLGGQNYLILCSDFSNEAVYLYSPLHLFPTYNRMSVHLYFKHCSTFVRPKQIVVIDTDRNQWPSVHSKLYSTSFDIESQDNISFAHEFSACVFNGSSLADPKTRLFFSELGSI